MSRNGQLRTGVTTSLFMTLISRIFFANIFVKSDFTNFYFHFSGLISALTLGSTRLTAKAIGVDGSTGEKVVLSSDTIGKKECPKNLGLVPNLKKKQPVRGALIVKKVQFQMWLHDYIKGYFFSSLF